jgi:hypothetical protein
MPTGNELTESSEMETSKIFLKDFDQLKNLSDLDARRHYEQMANSQNKQFLDQHLKSESNNRMTYSMWDQRSHVPHRNQPQGKPFR